MFRTQLSFTCDIMCTRAILDPMRRLWRFSENFVEMTPCSAEVTIAWYGLLVFQRESSLLVALHRQNRKLPPLNSRLWFSSQSKYRKSRKTDAKRRHAFRPCFFVFSDSANGVTLSGSVRAFWKHRHWERSKKDGVIGISKLGSNPQKWPNSFFAQSGRFWSDRLHRKHHEIPRLLRPVRALYVT